MLENFQKRCERISLGYFSGSPIRRHLVLLQVERLGGSLDSEGSGGGARLVVTHA